MDMPLHKLCVLINHDYRKQQIQLHALTLCMAGQATLYVLQSAWVHLICLKGTYYLPHQQRVAERNCCLETQEQ